MPVADRHAPDHGISSGQHGASTGATDRRSVMSHPEVVIHGTPELLAATTAARLVTKLVDIQSIGPDSRRSR